MPIQTIIQPSNFELCRDRIGEILAVELVNQRNMISPTDALLDATVWVERSVLFSENEYPAINVCLVQDVFEGETASTALGNVMYSIEVWASSPTTNEGRGDVTARMDVQRLLGIIRAILKHPDYKTLGFARPSLSGTSVGAIKIPDKMQDIQLVNCTVGILEFNVKVTENVSLITPAKIAGQLTVVKIEETDKGYRYEYTA